MVCHVQTKPAPFVHCLSGWTPWWSVLDSSAEAVQPVTVGQCFGRVWWVSPATAWAPSGVSTYYGHPHRYTIWTIEVAWGNMIVTMQGLAKLISKFRSPFCFNVYFYTLAQTLWLTVLLTDWLIDCIIDKLIDKFICVAGQSIGMLTSCIRLWICMFVHSLICAFLPLFFCFGSFICSCTYLFVYFIFKLYGVSFSEHYTDTSSMIISVQSK